MNKKAENIWYLYPIVGLEITDERPSFDNWLADDFTIFSKKHFSHLDSFFHKAGSRLFNYNLDNGFLDIKSLTFDSYIAIKIQIPKDTSKTDREFYNLALERAKYYEAILAVTFFAQNGTPVTFRLCGDHEPAITVGRLLGFESGVIGSGSAGGQRENLFIINGPGCLKYSYAEISKLLFHEYFPVGEVFFDKGKAYQSSRDNITASIIRLSESLLSTNYITKVLESAISIEVLLSNGNTTRQKILENRLGSLLENDWRDNMELYDKILKARNQFVHSGVMPDAKSLSVNAVELALRNFTTFIYYVKGFKNKSEFLDALDISYSGGRISSCKIDFGNTFSADRQLKKNILMGLPHFNPMMIKTTNY